MATLVGNENEAFEIQPITPTLEGPRDAYIVRLSKGSIKLFEQQYDVHDWGILSHYWVFKVAAVFQNAGALLADRLAISLNRDVPPSPRTNARIVLEADVDWLQVLLRGHKRDRKSKGVNVARVWVRIFCLLDYSNSDCFDSAENELKRFLRFQFSCEAGDAEKFGNDLYAELKKASDLRIDLGIETQDDYNEKSLKEP